MKTMKSLNTRILWYWTLYCIVGCSLLPDIVLSARYLPTRRSMPTQSERNERLKELFQHVSVYLCILSLFLFSMHHSIIKFSFLFSIRINYCNFFTHKTYTALKFLFGYFSLQILQFSFTFSSSYENI